MSVAVFILASCVSAKKNDGPTGFDDKGRQKSCAQLYLCDAGTDCVLPYDEAEEENVDKKFRTACRKAQGEIICSTSCCGMLCSKKVRVEGN